MTEYNLTDLQPFESMGIDFAKFDGIRTRIGKIEISEVPSIFGEDGKPLPVGQKIMIPVLKVYSEPLDMMIFADGSKKEIRASEMFNLKVIEKEGKKNIGWSQNPKGKLFQFMRNLKANTPQDLIGQFVTIVKRTGKDGRTYLGFAH